MFLKTIEEDDELQTLQTYQNNSPCEKQFEFQASNKKDYHFRNILMHIIVIIINLKIFYVDNDGKYMHLNIPELLVIFVIFSDNKMLFFGLSFMLCVLQLSGRNSFSGFKFNGTRSYTVN